MGMESPDTRPSWADDSYRALSRRVGVCRNPSFTIAPGQQSGIRKGGRMLNWMNAPTIGVGFTAIGGGEGSGLCRTLRGFLSSGASPPIRVLSNCLHGHRRVCIGRPRGGS